MTPITNIDFTVRIVKTLIAFLLHLMLFGTITMAQMSTYTNSSDMSSFVSTNSSSYIDKNDEEQKTKNESFFNNLIQTDNLSGNWWGVRNTLEESGLEFEFVYKGEVFSNVHGGNERGTTTLDNLDLIFSADFEKSLGLESSNLVIQILGNSGGSPSNSVGCSQGISNIETIPTWKLYLLLFEKKLLNNHISIMLGLYDLNSEFDTRETSSIFINPSHGIGAEIAQSGLNGPSIFPTTSVAFRIKYESESGNYFQTAVMDGVPGDSENPYGTHIQFNNNDGLLLTAEVGLVKNDEDKLDSKIALGTWGYTSNFEKNNFAYNNESTISLEKNYGVYVSTEKLLASGFSNPNLSLSGFLRIGYANKNINPVDYYFGAGLIITGLFEGQDEDNLGIAVAFAHNSSEMRKSAVILEDVIVKSYELNLEVTYTLNLTTWLMVQPDIQYIINPSYCNSSENAFAMGSRFQLIF